jgi:hypothetical protein
MYKINGKASPVRANAQVRYRKRVIAILQRKIVAAVADEVRRARLERRLADQVAKLRHLENSNYYLLRDM